MLARCPICSAQCPSRYAEKLDATKVTEFTFASRKRPELMHYELFECAHCELLFTDVIPDVSGLDSAYQQASFDSGLESFYAARTYWRSLKAQLPALGNGERILDVGCGDGQFMAEARRRGASVRGIEPSLAAVREAPKEVRSLIHVGGFQEFRSEEPFDLVCLFQTVEHIPEIEPFLRVAMDWLRPGGALAIACHNYLSPVNRILGQRSPIFDIEHLRVFSKKSIVRTLENAGFESVDARTYWNRYPLSYYARLAPLPSSAKTRAEKSSLLRGFALPAPLGNLLAIGTKP